jgi:hypothetical protein
VRIVPPTEYASAMRNRMTTGKTECERPSGLSPTGR